MAAKTPSHCFEATLEAVRLAVKYRTPVILLSDGYLANGTEPWRLPDLDDLPDIEPDFATATNHTDADGNEVFWPYIRDEDTLARPWAPPGVPGLEHRIGGLEKADGPGNVAYDGPNHERMTRLRAAKIAGIANDIPPTDVDDEDGRRGAGHRLGVDLRGHRRRGAAGAGPGPQGGPGPPRPPQPLPRRPRRGAAPLPAGAGARGQPGPAQPAAPGRVPGRRHLLHPGPGHPVPGGGDGGGHPPADRGLRPDPLDADAEGSSPDPPSNGHGTAPANGATATGKVSD